MDDCPALARQGRSPQTRLGFWCDPLRDRRPNPPARRRQRYSAQPSPTQQIVAPNLIRSQALSLLFESVRNGDLTEDLALQHHLRLTELKMRLLGDRLSRRIACRIACEQNWETTYDAEYIAVTQLQADALVTIDPALAMKAKNVVPLAPLDALIAR